MIELDPSVLLGVVLLTAFLSSLFTLVVLLLVYKYKIGPEIEHRVEGQLKKSVDVIEERIRKRMIEVLTGKSELLVGRARGLAKTGMNLFAGNGSPRSEDDESDDY